jgi:hypothetical protein
MKTHAALVTLVRLAAVRRPPTAITPAADARCAGGHGSVRDHVSDSDPASLTIALGMAQGAT